MLLTFRLVLQRLTSELQIYWCEWA